MWSSPASAFNRFCVRQLDVIDVDPDDPDTGLPNDPAHRTADPTTDIDHRHARLQLQLGDHQPLVPDFGVLQALLRREGREVQGFAPTVHHELVAQVVVVFHRFGVVVPVHAGSLRRRPVDPTVEVFHATGDVLPLVRLFQRVRQFA